MVTSITKKTFSIALYLLATAEWMNARNLDGSSKNLIVDSNCGKRMVSRMRAFLTVSSLAHVAGSAVVERRLEMNWYGGEVLVGDVVAVYDTEPSLNVPPLEAVKAWDYSDRFYRTHISYPRVRFAAGNLTSECLRYWIAYISQNRIADVNCMRARPYWVNENLKYIEGFTLREVALPGSHDAGSYAYFNPSNDDIVVRYTYSQEERVFEQLAYGVRHLDIRASYHSELMPKYWIHHNFVRTNNTLLEVLTDVMDFVHETKELVILDFHRFPYGIYTYEDHRKLIKYVSDVLRERMVPFNYSSINVTVGDILSGEGRVLVAYNHPMAHKERSIWPPLCQIWGNEDRVEDLKEFFSRFYARGGSPSYLWSSMAELTPHIIDILIRFGGLREMAQEINRLVTRWYRDLWWAAPNIVATDYILGNDIVEVLIESNQRRKICGISHGRKIMKELGSFCSTS